MELKVQMNNNPITPRTNIQIKRVLQFREKQSKYFLPD